MSCANRFTDQARLSRCLINDIDPSLSLNSAQLSLKSNTFSTFLMLMKAIMREIHFYLLRCALIMREAWVISETDLGFPTNPIGANKNFEGIRQKLKKARNEEGVQKGQDGVSVSRDLYASELTMTFLHFNTASLLSDGAFDLHRNPFAFNAKRLQVRISTQIHCLLTLPQS